MGPCMYCKQMIYHDAIAERGYHRQCRERAEAEARQKIHHQASNLQRQERLEREHEKRRERKRLKRIAQKAGLE